MSKQLIPFPLPEYLAGFLASQMNTPIEQLPSGEKVKALHIKRRSEFGKLIYRSLKKANRPVFAKEGFTFFISVSNYAGDHDKLVDGGRCSFLELGDREVKEIIAVFDAWFKSCLFHFIDGAVFSHHYNGKTKGIIHASIVEFMERYEISDSKTKFDTFVKHYQREKKRERPQLQRLT